MGPAAHFWVRRTLSEPCIGALMCAHLFGAALSALKGRPTKRVAHVRAPHFGWGIRPAASWSEGKYSGYLHSKYCVNTPSWLFRSSRAFHCGDDSLRSSSCFGFVPRPKAEFRAVLRTATPQGPSDLASIAISVHSRTDIALLSAFLLFRGPEGPELRADLRSATPQYSGLLEWRPEYC